MKMSFNDIIETFSESFLLTQTPNDINRSHPLYNRFKNSNPPKEELQEIRRKQFFENQKKNRNQILMRFRSLFEEIPSEGNQIEFMDTITDATNDCKRKTKNRFYLNKYKNQLMLSEWLVQIPEDFSSEWVLVICPIGKRCLVVSSKGQTKAYSRTGYLMDTFCSVLPGGNRQMEAHFKHNSVMDCIFNETQRVYYVLDVMSWNGSHFYDCETDFRFFWLHSKLETECPQISQKSKLNAFPFIPLKRYVCIDKEIVSALTSQSNDFPEVDGLLFYHKRCLYTPGVSPLVNWLKPNMVSDILKISIN